MSVSPGPTSPRGGGGVITNKIEALRHQIRDVLRGDEFQRVAAGLSGGDLSKAILNAFKRHRIGVTLISVGPAEKASLAEFAAVWQSAGSDTRETNWFSVKRR